MGVEPGLKGISCGTGQILALVLWTVVAIVGCALPAADRGDAPASAAGPTLIARATPTSLPEAVVVDTKAPSAIPTATLQGIAVIADATHAATVAPTLAAGARVLVPSLGIDVPLEEASWHVEMIEGRPVAVWETPLNVAGHLKGSALPGQIGNCVIAAHSRSDEGAAFYGLWDLEQGDQIALQDDSGKQYMYRVERSETVPELGQDLIFRQASAQEATAQTQDTRLTLITCWPDWAYTHRLVVVAQAVD